MIRNVHGGSEENHETRPVSVPVSRRGSKPALLRYKYYCHRATAQLQLIKYYYYYYKKHWSLEKLARLVGRLESRRKGEGNMKKQENMKQYE